MNKCLNCGKVISDDAELCSTECFTDYFKYVFGEDAKNHPEFKAKIEGDEN